MKLKQIPRNTVVHTPSEEEAKELLAILHENGWMITNSCANHVIKNAEGIQIYSETDWSWWERIESAKKENLTIISLTDFKRLYCEEEKPQPKFKVGDKVKVVGYQKYCITTMRPHVGKVGTIMATRGDRNYHEITCDKGRFSWHEDWLEPYTEPETKDGTMEETMETKENRKMSQIAKCIEEIKAVIDKYGKE